MASHSQNQVNWLKNADKVRYLSRRRFIAVAMIGCTIAPGTFADAPRSRARWPRNIVRALQRHLLSLGLNPGPIDGVWGPKTSAAIRQFQLRNDLHPDGRISEELLFRMGLLSSE